jgi:hypothetical protein
MRDATAKPDLACLARGNIRVNTGEPPPQTVDRACGNAVFPLQPDGRREKISSGRMIARVLLPPE